MREQPIHFIDKDAIKVWRISAALTLLIVWFMLVAAYCTLAYIFFEIQFLYVAISVLVLAVFIYFFIYLIPRLRYRRWRYEIFEQEIYIQRGILIMKRTIIPMIRVQHVDTKQGPILKRYRLATVTISTAATVHEIPALTDKDASDLRDRISVLARVDEDDV